MDCALERVEQGYTYAEAADGTPVAESPLRALYDDGRDLQFYAEVEDQRTQAAAQELAPLGEPDIPTTQTVLNGNFVRSFGVRFVVTGSRSRARISTRCRPSRYY